MFCIVRNPIDIFPSDASLRILKSHSLEFNEKINRCYPKWWDEYVKVNIERMKLNYETVVNTISQEIPTLFLRYEDLVLNPEKELTNLFCFLLDVTSIEGTIIQKRIRTVIQAGKEKS